MSARIVLVKPGDVLMIGNIGVLPQDAMSRVLEVLADLKEVLAIEQIVIFEGDIEIGLVEGTP